MKIYINKYSGQKVRKLEIYYVSSLIVEKDESLIINLGDKNFSNDVENLYSKIC